MSPKNVDQEAADVPGSEDLPPVEHAGETAAAARITLDSFVEMHRNQLESSAVPQGMWPVLFGKIAGQVYLHSLQAAKKMI